MSWKFYRKKVSGPYTILNSSALPGKVKGVSLVQEGLRRLRNTWPSLVPAGLRAAGPLQQGRPPVPCLQDPEDLQVRRWQGG